MIALGNSEVGKVYVGSTEIEKIYLGNELVYSQEPASYITDGLVFHLDGIEKGNTTGTWTDLVAGIVFTNTNVVSIDKGWQFDGTAYFYSTQVFAGSANHTVEVCFKPTGTSNYGLFACGTQTQYNCCFYRNNNSITFLQRSNIYNIPVSAGNVYSISLNLSNGLCNGVVKTKGSSTDYWGNSNFYVGKRSAGNYFVGEIYSIRIYNRRLTSEEQLNNFKVDNIRFELGITI